MNTAQSAAPAQPEEVKTEVSVRHPKNTQVEILVVNKDNGTSVATDLSSPEATAKAGAAERNVAATVSDAEISKMFSQMVGRIDGIVGKFSTSSFSELQETSAVVTSLKEVRVKLTHFAEHSTHAKPADIAEMFTELRSTFTKFGEAKESFSKLVAEGEQKKELSLLKGSLTNELKKEAKLYDALSSYCQDNESPNIQIKIKAPVKKAAAEVPKDGVADEKTSAPQPAQSPQVNGIDKSTAAPTPTENAPVVPPAVSAGTTTDAAPVPTKPIDTVPAEKTATSASVSPPIPAAGDASGVSTGADTAPKPTNASPSPAAGPVAEATADKSRIAKDLLTAFREFPESIPELANAKRALLEKIEIAKKQIAEANAEEVRLKDPKNDGKVEGLIYRTLPAFVGNWFRERKASYLDKPLAKKEAELNKMQAELRSIDRKYINKAREKFEGALFNMPKQNPDKIPGVIVRASIPAAKANTLFSFGDLADKLKVGAPAGTVKIDEKRGIISVIKDGKAVHFMHRRDGKVSVFADFGDGKGAKHQGSAWNDDALKGALKFAEKGHLKFVKRPWDEDRIIPPANMFKEKRTAVAPAVAGVGHSRATPPVSAA